MPDLRVDPDALDELARRLSRLKTEFENLVGLMEDYESAAGHREVAEKLEDFATNWSDARPEVTAQLEKLAGMAAGAACFYRDREAAMAAQMTQAAGGGTTGGTTAP